MAEHPENISLPVSWIGVDDSPIQYANQFLVQIQPGEVFLIVGQITPPALVGTPEEQLQQLRGWPFVPVNTVGRFGLTPQRLDELVDLLTRMQDQYKTQFGGGAK